MGRQEHTYAYGAYSCACPPCTNAICSDITDATCRDPDYHVESDIEIGQYKVRRNSMDALSAVAFISAGYRVQMRIDGSAIFTAGPVPPLPIPCISRSLHPGGLVSVWTLGLTKAC